MRHLLIVALALVGLAGSAQAQKLPLKGHPDTSGPGWTDLFRADLSNARFQKGVWTFDGGVLTASEDQAIWSEKAYDDFILDLEFKNDDGTNSGVIVHASDTENWIPNSVEIQIADDFNDKWAKSPATWRAGAFFGHKAATKSAVRKPGEWNRYTVMVKGKMIWVMLNGELVNEMDMSQWTSAKTNPDGTEIPAWLSRPKAELPLHGYIGLQGKHADATVWFRNVRIKELK